MSDFLIDSKQDLSNKDIFISALQEQVKKMEEMYKKKLDDSQLLRLKFCRTAQELSDLKKICHVVCIHKCTIINVFCFCFLIRFFIILITKLICVSDRTKGPIHNVFNIFYAESVILKQNNNFLLLSI